MKITSGIVLLGFLIQASIASLHTSCHSSTNATRGRCTAHNTYMRKEWSCLDTTERLDFINSVHCLMTAPSQLPVGVAPGARSRYDDFTATHINSSYVVHFSAVFLPWHRYFIYLLEKALREECGYKGYLPYANWPLYAGNLSASSLFDGSPTSLGGDGYLNTSNPNTPNGNYTPPAGSGGGCVTTGPFANTTVSFANIRFPGGLSTLPTTALSYTPHCLRRNLNPTILQNSANYTQLTRLLSSPNITTFQYLLDSNIYPGGQNIPDYGIHAGFHVAVGGEMNDFFVSPADPAFWLHHAMIDQLWARWQAMDPPNRQYALNGTNVLLNPDWAERTTVDTEQDFGYLDSSQRIGNLMDVGKGPFCYGYA